MLNVSDEAQRALDLAHALASEASTRPTTIHLLRALLAEHNSARSVLLQTGSRAKAAFEGLCGRTAAAEPTIVFSRLQERAQEVAQNACAREVACIHFLLALLRLREAQAFAVLEQVAGPSAELRAAAVGALSDQGPAAAPSTSAARPREPRGQRREGALGRGADKGDWLPGAAKNSGALSEPPKARPMRPPLPERRKDTSFCDRPRPPARQGPLPERPAERAVSAADAAAPKSKLPAPMHRGRLRRSPDKQARKTGSTKRQAPPAAAPAEQTLADIAPTLAECATDLTLKARRGELDEAIGREREQEALADVLGKRRANNPVLVGPPGVGKTAIVEGLALAWARAPAASRARARRLIALDTSALVAGTGLRGAFAERFLAIKQEVANAKGHLVVFIDELHLLIGAGAAGEGPQDAASELKTALARGEFPCIGATTDDEFKRYIERDAALERRFSPIAVAEPSCALAQQIVQGSLAPYEAHHQVTYAQQAVAAAITLSHRFITERKLPDKAFALLDLAGSRAHRRNVSTVDVKDVAEVVHEWTKVPLARLTQSEASRFARAEAYLGEHLVGHTHVIAAVGQALRRGFAGFNGQRPMGSFLLLGPTGVGKTELAKALATFIFGQADAMVRLDMSEFGEKHAVARLLGAQPGYVGYEEGGQLTEALRKQPFQIVLFDEIEKAHPDVLHVLLQLLDEGHLTDAQGRRISFAHTLVVLTSNLGAQTLARQDGIGFGHNAHKEGEVAKLSARQSSEVLAAAKARLPPELWSRLDEHLVFLPLSRAEMNLVVARQLQAQATKLVSERQVALTWNEQVVTFLRAASEREHALGTRGLRQTMARYVEAPLAEAILAGQLSNGCTAALSCRDDTLVVSLTANAPGADAHVAEAH